VLNGCVEGLRLDSLEPSWVDAYFIGGLQWRYERFLTANRAHSKLFSQKAAFSQSSCTKNFLRKKLLIA
jgi:hypothetical protein